MRVAFLHGYGANSLVGLNSVTYPDGSVSTFSTALDTATNTQAVSYDDAAAAGGGTHRRKTAYLSLMKQTLPQVVNVNGLSVAAVLGTVVNRVRRITDGVGDDAYRNWMTSGSGQSMYVYEGGGGGASGPGTLMRYDTLDGAPGQTFRALTWDPAGSEHDYTWELVEDASGDGSNRVVQTVDAINRKTVYTLDPNTGAHLTETRFNADGTVYGTESTSYNQFVEPLSVTDRLGRITNFTYDANGNLLTKTVAVGTPDEAAWSWTFNARGQPLTATDANGNTTNYNYDDPRGFLTSIVQPADGGAGGNVRGESDFTYDAIGRLATAADPMGRETQYAYDLRDRVNTITYSDNSTETFTYGTGAENHDASLLIQSKDRDGTVTVYDYDGAGRRVRSTVQAEVAAVHSYNYLPGTMVVSDETDRGKQSSYVYDYRLRPSTVTLRPDAASTLVKALHYDVAGRMDVETDVYGRKTRYAFDTDDRVTRVLREMYPGGMLFAVDPAHPLDFLRVLSTPVGVTCEDLIHDSEGQLLQRIDPNGNVSTLEYDGQGRVTAQTAASAVLAPNGTPQAISDLKVKARTEYAYDAQGNVLNVRHPRSFDPADGAAGDFSTVYTYTNRNLKSSVTEASGRADAAAMSFTYYLDGRIKDTVDARGNTWTKVWKQCCARLGASADPALADATRPVSLYEYDFIGNPTHVTRVKNVTPLPTCCLPDPVDADTVNEITTKYDLRHRPIARTVWLAPLGTVDENNPPIAGDNGIPAANGLTTRWRYDDDLTDGIGIDATYAAQLAGLNFGVGSTGYAVETTNPNGETMVAVYDGVGRVVRSIDGNGNVTNASYQAFELGLGAYDAVLLQTTVTDALGHSARNLSDADGHTVFSFDAEGKMASFVYDPNGNLTSFRDANNTGCNCVYDARNRKLSCTDRIGDVTSQTYDAHGNVISMTDGVGNTSTCSYDTRDRKVSCTDRLNGVTTYTYDPNSNLSTITDADANAAHTGLNTSYSYDPRNLLLSETYPDGKSKIFAYDGGNRLVSRTDQKNDQVAYNYDYANRMLSRQYPDSLNDVFTYDPAGRLLTAQSNRYTNTVTRTYDPGGRLATETQNIGGVNYPITYGYDIANRQTNVTYPDAKGVVRTFTARNQLSSLSYNGSSVATRTYDDGMRLLQTVYGNTITENRTYRTDNMPDSITDSGFGIYMAYGLGGQFDSNKRLVDVYNVITQIDDHYTYDKEDRLTGHTPTGGLPAESWSLTLAGDWNVYTKDAATDTRTHDAVHEIATRDGNALAYDLKGNLTDKGANSGTGGSGNTTYAWDFENRLTTAVSTGDNAATLGTYTYDALGRRTTKTANGITTVFVSDGLQEIAEYDNGAAVATPNREYVFGSYIDEPLLMSTGGQSYYYHSDYLYSVQALSDSAGHVIERYRYDPYGNVSIFAADFVTTRTVSSVGNPWGFTGRRLDVETGLMQYRSRYYDSKLGKFLNRSLWGYVQDRYSLYDYCICNPTNLIEPFSTAVRAPNPGTPWVPIIIPRTWNTPGGSPIQIGPVHDADEDGLDRVDRIIRSNATGNPRPTSLSKPDSPIPQYPPEWFPPDTPGSTGPGTLPAVPGIQPTNPGPIFGGMPCTNPGPNKNPKNQPYPKPKPKPGVNEDDPQVPFEIWKIKNNFPEGSAASLQLEMFVSLWNVAIMENGGSLTTRTQSDADEAASVRWREQIRQENPNLELMGYVVGHIPDASAGGPSAGGPWMPLFPAVNSSIGGQVAAKMRLFPNGYTYNRVQIIRGQ